MLETEEGMGGGVRAAPLVSVVLPTRDRLAYLREAVSSVRAQSLPRWELLVVDHGSRDGTGAWLDSLGDPRIRVLERPLPGANPARLRNEALRQARGRYVAFLDSDDLWEPEKLEIQLERMGAGSGSRPQPGSSPRWRWSYSAVTRVDAEGRLVSGEGIQPWKPLSGMILRELLAMEAILATPTVVAELALVREVGGFDASLPFCEDYDLWFRLAARAAALALPEPLAHVRVHRDNYSADRTGVHGCWVRVYEKAAASLSDPGLQRLCRLRRREHRVTHAALLADGGARRKALREILGVLRRSPGSVRAWRVLAGRVVLGRGTPRHRERSNGPGPGGSPSESRSN